MTRYTVSRFVNNSRVGARYAYADIDAAYDRAVEDAVADAVADETADETAAVKVDGCWHTVSRQSVAYVMSSFDASGELIMKVCYETGGQRRSAYITASDGDTDSDSDGGGETHADEPDDGHADASASSIAST